LNFSKIAGHSTAMSQLGEKEVEVWLLQAD